MTPRIPMRIAGAWREGYALDYHTIRSEFLGYDEHGREQFHTTRTELGELLYQFKYRSDGSALHALVKRAAEFVEQWSPSVHAIVPVPPTRVRHVQPVIELARGLGKRLNLVLLEGIVRNVKNTKQLKDISDYDERIRLLQDAYEVPQGALDGKSVLLFDDLYSSGATLNAVAQAPQARAHCTALYALALTRTGTAS